MSKKKKPNPRNKPAKMADVNRERRAGHLHGVVCTAALFLTVLLDKYNGREYIAEVWRNVEKYAEEMSEGRIKLDDLLGVLREEYDIQITNIRMRK